MDADIRYLGITVLLLVMIAAGHNLQVTEADTMDFGYCNTDIVCAGVAAGGMCLGVEQYDTQCTEPEQAESHREIEARCGTVAQNLCSGEEYTGTDWASATNVSRQSCAAWAQEDERIDLLRCDQTTPGVQEWSSIQ